MSHILDALQKLQEEKTAQLKQSAITGGILLESDTPRRRQTKRLLLIGLSAAVLLIGAAAFWFIQRPHPQQAQPKAPAPDRQQQAALQQPVIQQPDAPPPPLVVAPTPAQPLAPPAPLQPSLDEGEEDHPAQRASQAPAPAVAPIPSAPVTLGSPEGIKLSGIAWHDNRKLRRAVINDLLVAEGAEVAGARVLEIRTNLVRIEKSGTRFEMVLPH